MRELELGNTEFKIQSTFMLQKILPSASGNIHFRVWCWLVVKKNGLKSKCSVFELKTFHLETSIFVKSLTLCASVLS